MPRCICIKDCQQRVPTPGGSRIKYFSKDQIHSFKKCPENFRVLGGGGRATAPNEPEDNAPMVNFALSPEEEIREIEFPLSELKSYMQRVHPTVKFQANIGREKLIDKLIYARENDAERNEEEEQKEVAKGLPEGSEENEESEDLDDIV